MNFWDYLEHICTWTGLPALIAFWYFIIFTDRGDIAMLLGIYSIIAIMYSRAMRKYKNNPFDNED